MKDEVKAPLSRFGRGAGGEGAPGRSRPTRRWRLALGACGAVAAVLLGALLTLSTGKGIVQLEFSDAEAARQCTIAIDGDEIRLENLGAPIKLRPGKHQLRVTHGDLEIETREFTVLRRGTQVLHVSMPGLPKERALATAQDYADRGEANAEKGELSQAVVAYSEAIRLQPTVAKYYLARGKMYAERGDMERALADLSEAIQLEPTNVDARVNRSAMYATQGELGKAQADLKEALRIKPDCAEHYRRLGDKYRQGNQSERAIAEYRKAMRLDARYTAQYLFYGKLWRPNKQQFNQVLAEFRQLLRLRPDVAPAWLRSASWWLGAEVRGPDNLPGLVFVSDMRWVKSTCGSVRDTAARNGWFDGNPSLSISGIPYPKCIWTHSFRDGRPADVVVNVSGQDFAVFRAHASGVGSGAVQFEVLVDGKLKHQTPVVRMGQLQDISVDVLGGKEVVLRLLNGGDGNDGDGSAWGSPRFIEAGAEDPLEEPPAELRSVTDANAALLLAEVWWRLNEKDRARRWFDKAAAWMDKHPAEAEKLRQYRAEAAKLLAK